MDEIVIDVSYEIEWEGQEGRGYRLKKSTGECAGMILMIRSRSKALFDTPYVNRYTINLGLKKYRQHRKNLMMMRRNNREIWKSFSLLQTY